jgi:hypothetical protein
MVARHGAEWYALALLQAAEALMLVWHRENPVRTKKSGQTRFAENGRRDGEETEC